MSVEQLTCDKEFESKLSREVEKKFLPIFPERLDVFRTDSYPIEQFYLSHPAEPFSLRLRESFVDGKLNYEVTLKDSGVLTEAGVDRMEVTATISSELYAYYRSAELPIIRKLRTEPRPGVIIDFYEDGAVQVESENEPEWRLFAAEHNDAFVEITGDRSSTNEWQAHLGFRRANEGHEALTPQADLDPTTIVRDIEYALTTQMPTVVHIGGRSGSGKSTIVRKIRELLEQRGISSNTMSTDDYHRGTRWLTEYNGGEVWTHWDDAIVYDTKAMAIDLANLQSGQSIYKREIDWTIAEPHLTGVISPAQVIIIEGIYARSPDISTPNDLLYEMPTPLATCVGRRLLRDLRERPQFADPAQSLAYMLSEAEPAYRTQISALLAQTAS